jgi:DsbC/DsbD-like thiol-disulfide interchange protein
MSSLRQLVSIGACLLLPVALIGCANSPRPADPASTPQAERPKVTSERVVKVNAAPVQIDAGGSIQSHVRLTIDAGYHVNANPATFPYLIATELQVTPTGGVTVERVHYPPPLTRKFAFANESLAVYEGEAEITATLKATQSAKPGQLSLPAKMRIQACDDQVCYPPGTIELQIPLTIR